MTYAPDVGRRRLMKLTASTAAAAAVGGCVSGAQGTGIETVAVESDEDGEFYHPTQENIESGVYSPLTRPLFIYVSHRSLSEKPRLMTEFLRFYFDSQQEFARDVGFYATPDDVVQENHERLTRVLEELDVDPEEGEIRGRITCSGSNTLAPITDAAGEDFENQHPDVQVNVDPQGTGAGFSEFTRGNSDVQNASREIDESESARAEEFGVEYSRYTIGWDGLCVVKNAENTWCDRLTLEELDRIWRFQSPVRRWSDVRGNWPDERMVLYGRDAGSGTFDYFTLAVTGEVGDVRDDYSAHSQTANIMQGVHLNRHALGWGGVGYYHALKDHM